MTKFLVIFILLLTAVVGALYYFVYMPQQDALATARREASLTAQEASALRAHADDLENMLEELRQTSAELEAQIREKEEELAKLKSTQDELLGELEQEIADGQIQVERLRDQLRVDMVDEILFDSGEATIKPAGVEVLNRVGAVLKKAENKQIIVQGHTDNVPIVGRLAARFPTNWELSAARAVNVARLLQDDAGLDPTRLSATAFSEYQPRADNVTAEGRQKNRRIEIVLAPLPEALTDQPEEGELKPETR
jgi:chemotaxis protein MotB